MLVLTDATNGQLTGFYGPICDNVGRRTRCQCATLAGLQSLTPVEQAAVTDRDITPDELQAAVLRFLTRSGWAQADPAAARVLAAAMAADITDTAAQWNPGTRLHAHYNHRRDEWQFIEVPQPAHANTDAG